MLQRIHMTLTLALFLAVLFLGWRSREAERLLRAATQQGALHAREPVDEIVVEVGDVLQIIDEYNRDVCGQQAVAADGRILLPSAGWVRVAGLTRPEVEQALTALLEPYHVQALVRVRVNKPVGRYPAELVEAF